MTPLDEAAAHDPMPSLFVPADAEPGLTEHQYRAAFRDMIRMYGDEEATRVAAFIMEDELTKRPRAWRKS
jgi:hypothetical protein